TANVGTWTGTVPMTYSYQWESCDPTGNNCQPVQGATQSTYLLGPGDVGSTLVVQVTASNMAGSSVPVSSAASRVIAEPLTNAAPPEITGTAAVGQTLNATTGSWSGTPPGSYSYQWQSCGPTGSSCWNIAGATG